MTKEYNSSEFIQNVKALSLLGLNSNEEQILRYIYHGKFVATSAKVDGVTLYHVDYKYVFESMTLFVNCDYDSKNKEHEIKIRRKISDIIKVLKDRGIVQGQAIKRSPYNGCPGTYAMYKVEDTLASILAKREVSEEDANTLKAYRKEKPKRANPKIDIGSKPEKSYPANPKNRGTNINYNNIIINKQNNNKDLCENSSEDTDTIKALVSIISTLNETVNNFKDKINSLEHKIETLSEQLNSKPLEYKKEEPPLEITTAIPNQNIKSLLESILKNKTFSELDQVTADQYINVVINNYKEDVIKMACMKVRSYLGHVKMNGDKGKIYSVTFFNKALEDASKEIKKEEDTKQLYESIEFPSEQIRETIFNFYNTSISEKDEYKKVKNIKYVSQNFGQYEIIKAIKKITEEINAGTQASVTLKYFTNRIKQYDEKIKPEIIEDEDSLEIICKCGHYMNEVHTRCPKCDKQLEIRLSRSDKNYGIA